MGLLLKMIPGGREKKKADGIPAEVISLWHLEIDRAIARYSSITALREELGLRPVGFLSDQDPTDQDPSAAY